MSPRQHEPFQSVFPPSTNILDFAYPVNHPFRHGQFPVPKNYDGIGRDIDFDEDDEDEEDEDEIEPPTDNQYSADEINHRAIALFDFTPENDNEVALHEGQEIWISYRHGQGWLVAEDPATGENGLVPEEYVEIFSDEDKDEPKRFLPDILNYNDESEWVDTDDEVGGVGDIKIGK